MLLQYFGGVGILDILTFNNYAHVMNEKRVSHNKNKTYLYSYDNPIIHNHHNSSFFDLGTDKLTFF